jgi:hypothetical protein
MSSEALENAVRLLKRIGRGAVVSFQARPDSLEQPGVEHPWKAHRARVTVARRGEIWLVYDDNPLAEFLWPAEGYQYDQICVEPPPPQSRAVEPADPEELGEQTPAQEPRRATRQARQQPPPRATSEAPAPPAAATAMTTLPTADLLALVKAAGNPNRQRKRHRSLSSESDDSEDEELEIRDIAVGDKGRWLRLVPGIKVPVLVSDEWRWCFLYALDAARKRTPSLTAARWTELAMAFRLKKSTAFRNASLSDECDHLAIVIAEIVQTAKPRSSKEEWHAVFALVARYLHLVILASSMGGTQAAQKFSSDFEIAMASSEGKLDFATLVREALETKKETAPARTTPTPTPAVQETELQARVERSVRGILAKEHKPAAHQDRKK